MIRNDLIYINSWALSNITGDSLEYRDLVLSHGIMTALLPVINRTSKQLTLQQNISWILSNLCRHTPHPKWQYTKKIIKALMIMMNSNNNEILQNICWAFSYLTNIDEDNEGDQSIITNKIYSSGALARLVGLLDHNASTVRHPAIRSLGNIVVGDDKQTQWVVDTGILRKLRCMLVLKEDNSVRIREICWMISNITAGNETQIEAVIKADLIPQLIDALNNYENGMEIATEACWALSNATSDGNDSRISFLVDQGIISALCLFLKKAKERKCAVSTKEKHYKCIVVALEGLQNVLRAGEKLLIKGCNKYAVRVRKVKGVQILEAIQDNKSLNEKICGLARQLIGDYFNGKSECIDYKDKRNNKGLSTKINGDGRMRKCKNCRVAKGESKLFVCKRCRKVRYCGRACQKKHWMKHRNKCVSIVTS